MYSSMIRRICVILSCRVYILLLLLCCYILWLDGKTAAGWWNQCFPPLHSNMFCFLCTPWQYTTVVQYVLLHRQTASFCLHPRPLRARAAPQAGVSPPRRSPPCNYCNFTRKRCTVCGILHLTAQGKIHASKLLHYYIHRQHSLAKTLLYREVAIYHTVCYCTQVPFSRFEGDSRVTCLFTVHNVGRYAHQTRAKPTPPILQLRASKTRVYAQQGDRLQATELRGRS